MARKPGKVLPLGVDACRVPTEESTLRPDGKYKKGSQPHSNSLGKNWNGNGFSGGSPLGRWPANVVLSVPGDEYILKNDVTAEQKRELFRWLHENPE